MARVPGGSGVRRPNRSVLMERGQLEDRNPEALSLDVPLLSAQSPAPQVDPTAFREPSEADLFEAAISPWRRFVSPSQEEAARRRAALAAFLSEFMSPSMEGLEADLRSRGFDGEVAGAPLTGNMYTWRKTPPFPKLPRAGSDLRKMIRAVLGI